jgi:DNA-binding MarR family transcriptional regulator
MEIVLRIPAEQAVAVCRACERAASGAPLDADQRVALTALARLIRTSQAEKAPLTAHQADVLHYVRGYIEQHEYAPSFKEIARKMGFSSLGTVHEHLQNLERKGYIRRSYNEARSISIL